MNMNPNQNISVAYKTRPVDGLDLFYREAGNPANPALLLLHGFPTSSHMFRNLIPKVAGHFHVVAPDLPGFGFSSAPSHEVFQYTFAHLSELIGKFTEQIGLKKFAIYVFDYGAPVGFRLALNHPTRLTGIISQNGNAYLEGLGEAWNPIRAYWENPSSQNRDALRAMLSLETTRWQYYQGVENASERIAPETIALDQAWLDRTQSTEIQLDLFGDYKSNVALYPAFQEFFRKHQLPTLAVWGKNDPIFLPAGAEAYRRDNPSAKIVLYDTGHFALETHVDEIASEINAFGQRLRP